MNTKKTLEPPLLHNAVWSVKDQLDRIVNLGGLEPETVAAFSEAWELVMRAENHSPRLQAAKAAWEAKYPHLFHGPVTYVRPE